MVAAQAVADLRLPAGVPRVGPDPSHNEWNMVAVGYPIWLWTDDPASTSTTVNQQGITITITATRSETTFSMGDGTTVRCATSHRWTPAVAPGAPSPSCGHGYQQKPLRGTTYTITASSRWTAAWSALGQSGTIPLTRTSPPRQLEVGELVSVINRAGTA
ncbi:hypothetical protein [Mariniluteicoccus endophyticus]